MPTPVKTDAMHKLTGTKSQAKATEPDYVVPPGRPRYPKNLSPEAKAVFKRLWSLLEKRRALTEADGELLRLYAILFDRHTRAMEKIAEQGEIRMYTRLDSNGVAHDVEKPNMWLKIAETCEKNMVACIDRLGFSPLNRAKVKPTAVPAEKQVDPMDDFLARGSKAQTWVLPPQIDEMPDADTNFAAE
jgi:P27 family predicted phage terminase small subunit